MLTLSLNFFSSYGLRVRTLCFALALALSLSAKASAQQTPKPVAGSSVNALVTTIVNTANKVPDTADAVVVTVGRSVQQGSQMIGKEILKSGEVVGYAVANPSMESWNLLRSSCGAMGRKASPVDTYFQGANRIKDTLTTYSTGDKNNTAVATELASKASACFEQVQDGYYCAFPKELEQIVSQAGAIPGNRVNLATRAFREASSKDCLAAAATAVGSSVATSSAVCALGKVVVADAQKAFACFSAAESKGVMKKFFTPAAASSAPSFPNKASCEGIGELAFMVAVAIVTDGLSKEAKAAKAQGKSNTLAIVADELRTVYKIAAAGATYQQVVDELEKLPECK